MSLFWKWLIQADEFDEFNVISLNSSVKWILSDDVRVMQQIASFPYI